MKQQSNFEVLIEQEKRQLAEEMFTIPLGDSYMLARNQGRKIGLERALQLHRQSARIDLDEDAS
jgi:hypothetical protein